MPRLLWRYMLWEFVRTVTLTTLVLVAVAAFGATIKPLADDSLLGAGQVARYLVLVTVPMLQFALPFAAGFGATLVMYRLVSDNEMQAMSVSGIGYARLLAPVGGLGLALFVIMTVLTQWVIPRFWAAMQETLANDAIQMLQASVERGVPFEAGGLQIHADRIKVEPAPADTGADTRLQLWKVVAGRVGSDGRLETDFTATRAAIDVFRREGTMYLNLVMREPTSFSGESGEFATAPDITVRTYPLPLNLQDKPVAMSHGELRELRTNPEGSHVVRQAMQRVMDAIVNREARQSIRDAIESSGSAELIDGADSAITYRIEGQSMPAGVLRGNPAAITRVESGTPVWRAESRRIAIQPTTGDLAEAGTFTVSIETPTVVDLRAESPPTPRPDLIVPRLVVAGIEPRSADGRTAEAVFAEAAAIEGDGAVANALENLDGHSLWVTRSAHGSLLERHALSVTAPLVLFLGAAMAMLLRGSLPLTIYFWAFLPSLGALIVIPAGRHLIKHGNALGPLVLWSGVIVLALVVIAAYLRLRRH